MYYITNEVCFIYNLIEEDDEEMSPTNVRRDSRRDIFYRGDGDEELILSTCSVRRGSKGNGGD